MIEHSILYILSDTLDFINLQILNFVYKSNLEEALDMLRVI